MGTMDEYKKKIGNIVEKKSDFPKGAYYAIIEFDTYSYEYNPGNHDGRSDTCTGTTMSFRWWDIDDKQYWIDKIHELMTGYSRKEFIALDNGELVEPKLKVEVEI